MVVSGAFLCRSPSEYPAARQGILRDLIGRPEKRNKQLPNYRSNCARWNFCSKNRRFQFPGRAAIQWGSGAVRQADDWLTKFQQTPAAWQVSDTLLSQADAPMQFRFFDPWQHPVVRLVRLGGGFGVTGRNEASLGWHVKTGSRLSRVSISFLRVPTTRIHASTIFILVFAVCLAELDIMHLATTDLQEGWYILLHIVLQCSRRTALLFLNIMKCIDPRSIHPPGPLVC